MDQGDDAPLLRRNDVKASGLAGASEAMEGARFGAGSEVGIEARTGAAGVGAGTGQASGGWCVRDEGPRDAGLIGGGGRNEEWDDFLSVSFFDI